MVSPLFKSLLTQGWNLGLLHCRQFLYYLSHQGSPIQLSSPSLFILLLDLQKKKPLKVCV